MEDYHQMTVQCSLALGAFLETLQETPNLLACNHSEMKTNKKNKKELLGKK